ncbi:hypothetical protein OFB58_26110, partial [Escherichia coli]|nr:hypothetical protein [Escherichia coli]
EVVQSIAAENQETRDRRQALTAQRKAIEEAKDACAGLAMRKELREVYMTRPPWNAAAAD